MSRYVDLIVTPCLPTLLLQMMWDDVIGTATVAGVSAQREAQMEVEGINTIFMFVADLPRSQDFYQKLIGREPERQRENLFASFQLGGVNLLLHSDANATWLP